VVDRCAEQDVAFVPSFSIASVGTDADAGGDSTLTEIADRDGANPAQVRLARTLHRARNVLAIHRRAGAPRSGRPGTHVDQNVAAASLRLTEDDLATLRALVRPA